MRIIRSRGFLGLFLFILAVEIEIALHWHDAWVRPYGGDALSVVLVYALVRAFREVQPWRLALGVLGVALAVELAQYARMLAWLGVENAFVRTVLGSEFDWGDLLAYALGAASILLAHALVGLRRRRDARLACGSRSYESPRARAR
jgi:hypothetical protein